MFQRDLFFLTILTGYFELYDGQRPNRNYDKDAKRKCWDYLFLKHYDDLGCTPDHRCSFDCSNFYNHYSQKQKGACFYQGTKYQENEMIPSISPCQNCQCVAHDREKPHIPASFKCTNQPVATQCPEPALQKACSYLYNPSQCCHMGTTCNALERRARYGTCKYEIGLKLMRSMKGRKVQRSACQICICNEPNRTLFQEQFVCYEHMCNLAEMQDRIANGCTPVYKGSPTHSCCPVTYTCPSAAANVQVHGSLVQPQDNLQHPNNCIFNGKLYPVGSDITLLSGQIACRCARPPITTCTYVRMPALTPNFVT